MSDVAAMQIVNTPTLMIEGRLVPEEICGAFVGCVMQCVDPKRFGIQSDDYVVAPAMALETLRRHDARAADWFARAYPALPAVFVFPKECAETISVFGRFPEDSAA